jgi:hypothetical protein
MIFFPIQNLHFDTFRSTHQVSFPVHKQFFLIFHNLLSLTAADTVILHMKFLFHSNPLKDYLFMFFINDLCLRNLIIKDLFLLSDLTCLLIAILTDIYHQ